METGNRRILVVGAEHLSRWVDWEDRNMAVLLADGAGATVLEYEDGDSDILSFSLGTDGSAADLLTCEHGGYIQMDGKEVFRRAVRVVVSSAEEALEQGRRHGRRAEPGHPAPGQHPHHPGGVPAPRR